MKQLGQYRIERLLGAGGMGKVYLATDLGSGAQRALKVLLPGAEPELIQRFEREGEAQARVDEHPHVNRVHALGREAGVRYLVQDFLPGGDLEGRLRQVGRLPVEEARALGIALAKGLAHVHALGVLHRDLKPANVLFDEAGQPRLTDFGLARLADGRSLTQTGELLGTPVYMSPEQALGQQSDARSDVYALGALLYACLAGVPPFLPGPTLRVLSQVLERRPEPLPSEVPPHFASLVFRALEKDPARRFPSAEAFAEALAAPPPQPRSKAPWLALAGLGVVALLGAAALNPAEAPPEPSESPAAQEGSAAPAPPLPAPEAGTPAERIEPSGFRLRVAVRRVLWGAISTSRVLRPYREPAQWPKHKPGSWTGTELLRKARSGGTRASLVAAQAGHLKGLRHLAESLGGRDPELSLKLLCAGAWLGDSTAFRALADLHSERPSGLPKNRKLAAAAQVLAGWKEKHRPYFERHGVRIPSPAAARKTFEAWAKKAGYRDPRPAADAGPRPPSPGQARRWIEDIALRLSRLGWNEGVRLRLRFDFPRPSLTELPGEIEKALAKAKRGQVQQRPGPLLWILVQGSPRGLLPFAECLLPDRPYLAEALLIAARVCGVPGAGEALETFHRRAVDKAFKLGVGLDEGAREGLREAHQDMVQVCRQLKAGAGPWHPAWRAWWARADRLWEPAPLPVGPGHEHGVQRVTALWRSLSESSAPLKALKARARAFKPKAGNLLTQTKHAEWPERAFLLIHGLEATPSIRHLELLAEALAHRGPTFYPAARRLAALSIRLKSQSKPAFGALVKVFGGDSRTRLACRAAASLTSAHFPGQPLLERARAWQLLWAELEREGD